MPNVVVLRPQRRRRKAADSSSTKPVRWDIPPVVEPDMATGLLSVMKAPIDYYERRLPTLERLTREAASGLDRSQQLAAEQIAIRAQFEDAVSRIRSFNIGYQRRRKAAESESYEDSA